MSIQGTTVPKARRSDPVTSHEAAESVSNVTETQRHLMAVPRKPMTHDRMIFEYRKRKTAPWASDSGLRSRCAELVDSGLVRVAGEAKSPSGRRAYLWQVA